MLSDKRYELILYARKVDAVKDWLNVLGLSGSCLVESYDGYGSCAHEAVINFVGVGDPARAAEMGASIFDITLEYDQMILDGLKSEPTRRYIFLSSGAAYGSNFKEPACIDTLSSININRLVPQEYYALAKLHAEGRHRSLMQYNIVDIRVFNYFSSTVSLDSRFFITDLIRSVKNQTVFKTGVDEMARDYLHSNDFFQLTNNILQGPLCNMAVDCYSKSPISKTEILELFRLRYGLQVEVSATPNSINATGSKPNYFSKNYRAAEFGYVPKYSSYEGLVEALETIFHIS